ncbi:hypothetical protein C8R45DRAFT_1011291 [Mycena sanguinolenta]|nr:hypothetical protein C8R45DRAFT_1011291 [Mycena sanguinolenta]
MATLTLALRIALLPFTPLLFLPVPAFKLLILSSYLSRHPSHRAIHPSILDHHVLCSCSLHPGTSNYAAFSFAVLLSISSIPDSFPSSPTIRTYVSGGHLRTDSLGLFLFVDYSSLAMPARDSRQLY